jgi:lysophospholipase L1-like esterase
LFDAGNATIWYRWIMGGGATQWYKIYPLPSHSVSVLENKKLVTAGDSYTAALFAGNPKNGRNFGYYISQRNNMQFVNAGISGSIMALDKTYVDSPTTVPIDTRNPFSYQRYLEIPSDTDYLTLWFGINDTPNTYLGTIDDETNETFYGAWNVVLKYYLTNRPFMHVGIVVTTGASPSYQNAIREVAAKWGYPLLDLVNGTDTPAFFDRANMSSEARDLRRNAYGWNTWNAHPNPEWHEFISGSFEEFLKRC